MPSPLIPASRKNPSLITLPNTTASSRPDLLTSRGLRQGLFNSANSPTASRAVPEKLDEHKENATEIGNKRGAGRSNQNFKAPRKKAWVTHFAKTNSALSPSNRILAERNSSCSPVRSESIRGNAGAPSDEKPKATPPKEQEDTVPASGPVKGVAELSKRIQQFLEDQEALLGIKTGRSARGCNEVASACASPSVDPGQLSLSSPYDPYNSPFFERPKFLRLHGNASSMDAVEKFKEQNTEELPLFEGDQIMVTPLQPIKFSTNLSPLSTEDVEVERAEEAEEQFEEAEIVGDKVCMIPLQAKAVLKYDGEVKCTEESIEKDDEAKKEKGGCRERFKESEEHGDASIAPEISKNELQIEEGEIMGDEVCKLPLEAKAVLKYDGEVKCTEESIEKDDEAKEEKGGCRERFKESEEHGDASIAPEISKNELQIEEGEIMGDEVCKLRLEAKALLKYDSEVKCTEVSTEKEDEAKEEKGCLEQKSEEDGSASIASETSKDELQIEDMARKHEKETAAGSQDCLQPKGDKALLEASMVNPLNDSKGEADSKGQRHIKSVEVAEVELADEDVSPWGRKIVWRMFYATLLVAFLALALLASGSPGLLPPSLRNNPVSSLWRANKYRAYSLVFSRGLNGLWSTELIYIPADVRVAVLSGEKLFRSTKKLSDQVSQVLQLHFQVMSHILEDWWKLLLQHLPLNGSPNAEDGRHFEWIQEYSFQEEWLDEEPTLAYTDWELLHEYDLWAANQYVLGSIPEILRNDLRRNFSGLSDSPEVKGLLDDMMRLKGGSTEEDRLEVLQYFWEYTRFSASVQGSFMGFQVEPTAAESSKAHGLPLSPELQNLNFSPHSAEIGLFQGAKHVEQHPKIHLTDKEDAKKQASIWIADSDSDSDSEVQHLEVQTKANLEFSKSEQLLQEHHPEVQTEKRPDLSEIALTERGEIENEVFELVFDKVQTVDRNMLIPTLTIPKEIHEAGGHVQGFESEISANRAVLEADAITEQREANKDEEMATTEIQSTSFAEIEFSQLATIATTIAASLLILGRFRRFKDAARLTTPASSVQFLRKNHQQHGSLAAEPQQYKQAFAGVTTMIEELNDSSASVLRSPEPNFRQMRSPHGRGDEDLIRSPLPGSANSPYGSFTTYKMVSKKEGQTLESKLTPVRRSSRLRNHASMSPNANGAKRIAISPP